MGKSFVRKSSIHTDLFRQQSKHKFQHSLTLLPGHQELKREWDGALKHSVAPISLAVIAGKY